VTKTVSLAAGAGIRLGAAPPGAWLLSHTLVGPNGQTYGGVLNSRDLPAACLSQHAHFGSCLASHGFHQVLTYQPASRFWAFQGIETGIFVALAAILVAVTFRLVLRRDA
jgi:hypothetical protein